MSSAQYSSLTNVSYLFHVILIKTFLLSSFLLCCVIRDFILFRTSDSDGLRSVKISDIKSQPIVNVITMPDACSVRVSKFQPRASAMKPYSLWGGQDLRSTCGSGHPSIGSLDAPYQTDLSVCRTLSFACPHEGYTLTISDVWLSFYEPGLDSWSEPELLVELACSWFIYCIILNTILSHLLICIVV